MWYSSFWSEGPKNHQNLKILVSKFVPRGFEAQQTWGFEAQHQGFRGAATWDLEAQQQVGWDLEGQQRDLEAQQHTWDRVIKGLHWVTIIAKVWYRRLGHQTFYCTFKNQAQQPKCRQTVTFSIRKGVRNKQFSDKKIFRWWNFRSVFPLSPVQRGAILLGAMLK